MRSEKKGQMEVIGLVIIVILITIGMLFMATFALKSEPHKKIFTRKGLAYSTLSAVMKTTVSKEAACFSQGYGQGMPKIGADIIEDCVKYKGTDFSIYRCEGPVSKTPLHSCAFFSEMADYLLDLSLGGWNKNYEFHSQLIPFQGSNPIDLIVPITAGGGCPAGKERDSSGLFPISTDSGSVENILYLCD
ncbi:MAG: hypothetical protein AABX05_00140 [Nanoarchaeota archaeon]